ncbi:unnamed protein product [Cryptosporidium hominis]|uniref:Uncharacterized protein n=2 Tax=Cryptosporidium hominis TaxID=237895 RepID=A0A0S4TBI7_CRYHO|nr:hypothetical protein ChTU502y2012_418g0110 [Cryptosporidium hominis]PPS95037.1 Uncharacterized protein GY17_00002150 [Cryptosporidium hominis]CUV04553.1 unnamed protein product [Cryptosporidium hominis]|eukprot:PPS95037.1 Uncharacterized protein GY17_00002150 [Cryptosporidium hominis]
MDFYNEMTGKRKINENMQIISRQSLEELNLNTSDNNLDEAFIYHNEINISKINGSSINFYSLRDSKTNTICTRNLHDVGLESHRLLVADGQNLSKIDIEIDTKKKIISSMLNILKDHAAEIHYSSGGGNKNLLYFYTLFQDCVSNFLIEGFGSLIIDSMIDILLPVSNLFYEMELECDFQNYNVISSILYYYLVGVTPNNILFSEKPFININLNEKASSFLLPISRAVSEVDYAWLTRQNFPEFNLESNNKNRCSKLESSKEIISIFEEEHIPKLIMKIVNYLKNMSLIANCDNLVEEHSISYLLKDNPIVCDSNQTPFYIGRLLEICFSKHQKEFTSIFLQLNGPLVIIPFINYSSIQDFFLRFFGIIGNNCQQESKFGEYSNSLLDFEYLESNRVNFISEFGTDKPYIQEHLLEVGISPIIYEWVIESDFIQNLLSPLLDVMSYNQEDFVEKPEFKFRPDIINVASGIIEVIFRLVEYLKPEHTGLPLNMTSIGLKWLTFSSELNNLRSLYFQNELNKNLNLSCGAECEISNSVKFVNIEHSITEGNQLYNSSFKTSQKKIGKNNNFEYENSGKRFNSNEIPNGETNLIVKNKDDTVYGTKVNNCLLLATNDGDMIKNFSMYQVLEKSKRFLNNLIIDSSMLKIFCELSVHSSNKIINENIYILKLRSLSILEEVINLAFSVNINVIGCLKTKIINDIKPYLTKFCEFIISKFEIDANSKETAYMVSLLTIIKTTLLYDEKHELINYLNTEFWVWLLDVFIRRRENSHISVQCKTIFELGIRFGSYSTLENLFNKVKLVDKVSKFIYDGTDLDGNLIEEREFVNKKTGKRIRRVFGSIYNLFIVLEQIYNNFLKIIVPYNPYIYEVIKNVIFSQLNNYSKIDDEAMEMLGLLIKNEFEINYLSQDSEKIEFESPIDMDPQKISLLANLSCNTKFHELAKSYQSQNKTNYIQNSFSKAEDLSSKLTKNIENSTLTPNSIKKKTNSEDPSISNEINTSNNQSPSKILRSYFSGSIVDLFNCDENCECPKWSFCNVLNKLKIEKNCSTGIPNFPVLPLEESKKIRETRKRQIKLCSSAQKND